jgi:hypothetical protein
VSETEARFILGAVITFAVVAALFGVVNEYLDWRDRRHEPRHRKAKREWIWWDDF